jgi:serine/threonine protein kinase
MNPKDRKRQMIKMQKDKGKAEPKMLSNYLIDREIGAGVSSRVYSAINIFTGERVAIKKIKNFL